MKRKTVSGIMLSLLLMGMLTLAVNIQPAKAEPQPILETDKDVYILGENVTIILANIGTETIQIGGYPIWEIYTYPEEEPVYPSVFAFLAWSLEPGENDTITWNQTNQFTHSPAEAGMYVVRELAGWGLSAYFEIVPSNPLGDINDDGIVDIADIVIVAIAFGSKPKDPNWNPVANLNHDDLIDIVDIILVVRYFGKRV